MQLCAAAPPASESSDVTRSSVRKDVGHLSDRHGSSVKKLLEPGGTRSQIDRCAMSRDEPARSVSPRLGRQPLPQRRPVANHEEGRNPIDSQAGCTAGELEECCEQWMRRELRQVEKDVGDVPNETLRRTNLDQGFAGPEIRELDERH